MKLAEMYGFITYNFLKGICHSRQKLKVNFRPMINYQKKVIFTKLGYHCAECMRKVAVSSQSGIFSHLTEN